MQDITEPCEAPTINLANHLASLGGHDTLAKQYGLEIAHRIWDSARLWERDKDTGLADVWMAQYWAAIKRGKVGEQ